MNVLHFTAAAALLVPVFGFAEGASPPPAGHTGPEPQARPVQQKSRAMAKLAEWQYADPKLQRQITRFVEIAEDIADDKWCFDVSVVSSAGPGATINANFSWKRSVAPAGKARPYPYRPYLRHMLCLTVYGTYPRVDRFTFETYRQESPSAMTIGQATRGIGFEGITQDGSDGRFSLFFPIVFPEPVIEYRGVVQRFHFSLPEDERYANWKGNLLNILSSAETMRDAMLRDLDAYEAHVIANLKPSPDGFGDTRAYPKAKAMRLWEDGRKFPSVEYGVDQPGPEIVSDEEFEQAKRLIVDQINTERAFIRAHYKMLFEESEKTFPVTKWMADEH